MEDNRCFEPGCMLNVEYACPCCSPPVYTCKMHVLNHKETPNKDHALKSIFVEPCEKTRGRILFVKGDSSINKDFNHKFKEEKKIQRNIRGESRKSKILKSSKNPKLPKKLKSPYSTKNDSCTPETSKTPLKHPYSTHKNDSCTPKTSNKKSKNPYSTHKSHSCNPETSKKTLKHPYSAHKNDSCTPKTSNKKLKNPYSTQKSDSCTPKTSNKKLKNPYSTNKSDSCTLKTSVSQTYLKIVSGYQQKQYVFNILNKDDQTNLLIYNTEIESQASIILETPQPLSCWTCIAQLPNGKLFCFGNTLYSGITLLIDENYKVEELPSGAACGLSSAIYFNNNVYCFGGFNDTALYISSRFDLDRNQWKELTPLPNDDRECNSIIFNGIILIAGRRNKNLLRYSIDNNSFSTIPYSFTGWQKKILINGERLYLIECMTGSIYESEIGSDSAWRQITNQSIIASGADQTYCQYNKEWIYIGLSSIAMYNCVKFKLNDKRLIKLV